MTTAQRVIVVGGGHAGCEAALASARLGVDTTLITMDPSALARMSCNPSVGGLGKSHIVAEVDALGGEMGRNADFTGIQFRTLNTKKGPAVQASRIQSDRIAYSARMCAVVVGTPNLRVVAGEVLALEMSGDRLTGVKFAHGDTLPADGVVLTPGTFLGGLIHVGKESHAGGRIGEPAAIGLGEALKKMGLEMGRLKTGTPPRIEVDSVEFSLMQRQDGDIPPPFFTMEARKEWELFHVEQQGSGPETAPESGPMCPWIPGAHQVPCFLTHTTPETHRIVRENLGRSSLYGGQITGTGVRYCPSFEDKIVKFPDKDCHHVFIEPDGLDSPLIYPNGLSNSLPAEVQEAFIHTIPGLQKAVFSSLAYAIEYDFVQPTQLDHTLALKGVKGLFMAGQICGTTGYEEAGGQGLVAGINAALYVLGRQPFRLTRQEAYLGVMIDDLVTRGTDEPYRMFTSRAEYRLVLRQDNARLRLLDRAREVGLVCPQRLEETARLKQSIAGELERMRTERARGQTLLQLLLQGGGRYRDMPACRLDLDAEAMRQIETEARYDGYIANEMRRIAREREMEEFRLPESIDYSTLKILSYEAREKLARVRPSTLGQAARIPGIRAVDVSILAAMLRK